jgi:hypothetical protein
MTDHNAEFMRALRLYIATANLETRAMKAARSKDASAEFSQNYQTAIEHLHKAGRALKAMADSLQPPKAKK